MASDIQHIKAFPESGLDTDSDILFIQGADSRYRLNIILSEDGNYEVISNVKGNVLRSITLPTGNSRVIGFVEDQEDKAGIYFIYNDDDDHSIIKYFSEDGTLEYILNGSQGGGAVGNVLNFQAGKYISAGVIGNEDDKYLVWTDGVNEIRMINILLARNFTNGGSPAYDSITENVIRFYKKPMLAETTVGFSGGSGVNNIRGSIWQFAIRIKYLDNTYSVLSPYTEARIPIFEENANSLFTSNPQVNATLRITFTPEDEDNVSEYQLIYRKVDESGGVPGSWFRYTGNFTKTIDQYQIFFNNKQSGVVISDQDVAKLYDFVPDLAMQLGIIDSNRVVVGGILEGYDNIPEDDLDVDFVLTRIHMPDDGLVDDLTTSNTIGIGAKSAKIPTDKNLNDDYYYAVQIAGVTPIGEFKVVTSYKMTETEVAADLSAQIDAVADLASTAFTDGYDITNNTASTIKYSQYVLEPSRTYKSFKAGSTLYFGLQYLNEGKPWFIQTSPDFVFDVPYQYESVDDNSYTGNHDGLNNSTILVDTGESWDTDEFVGQVVTNTTKGTSGIITSNTATVVTAQQFDGSDFDWDTGDAYTISFKLLNYYNQIEWTINHQPPTGSTHYQWVYLGNNIDTYEYYFIDESVHVTEVGNYTLISKDILTDFRQAYDDTIIYGIDYQKGDRIRFIGIPVDIPDDVSLSPQIELLDELFDYEILEVDATDIKITNIGSFTDKFGDFRVYVEIYRTRQISDETGLYQAVSPIFKIENTNGILSHNGDTESQEAGRNDVGGTDTLTDFSKTWTVDEYVGRVIKNLTDGSQGTVTANTANTITAALSGGSDNNWGSADVYFIETAKGDFNAYFASCFMRYTAFVNGNNTSEYSFFDYMYAWRESYNVSLLYESQVRSFGKQNIVNEFAVQKYYNKIRWGGKFIDESAVNFISRFDAGDERILDDRNGVVNKIQQIADTLKVYQERKITSFYLKTVSSTDADGNDTYVFSDDVMSVGRQSVENYGCSHFTSYIRNVRNAYFFDIIHGAVVRDSANGYQEISQNRMHSYFKQKARDIVEYSGTVDVFGGWDEDLEMYMITFVDLSTLSASINETLGFHEPSNRWLSFYSFLPEFYGKIAGDQLLSFRDGELWEHNVNATRNNFFGEQFSSEIWLHMTEQQAQVKIYDSIEVNSDGQWTCPDYDSIVIERPILMQSRLVAGKFRLQEGIYRAEFLRDALNGGSSPTRDNLVNGRYLRGKEMTIKFKNSDTTQAILESVLVRSTLSK